MMPTDTPKIQYQNEVEVWVKNFGETRSMNPQKPKTRMKMRSEKYEEIVQGAGTQMEEVEKKVEEEIKEHMEVLELLAAEVGKSEALQEQHARNHALMVRVQKDRTKITVELVGKR